MSRTAGGAAEPQSGARPPYLLAPSILAADLARLGEEISAVLDAGADLVHLDVMDNHYVPNLTFGPVICEAIRGYGISADIDVHLMARPVDELVRSFAAAGASYITFHPEASEHVDRTLSLIRDLGCKAGLVLNPATSLHCLEFVLDKLDLVLLMSVNPGFGGQQFIPAMLGKIAQAKRLLGESGRSIRLEVDGGVTLRNIAKVAAAGADMFVAGSAIFGSADYRATIQGMRRELAAVAAGGA